MLDIQLDKNGDLAVSETGDIFMTQSVKQAVLIRLRWIYNEWRLGPELGFPWFEEVFVKNPNTLKIRQLIREEILKVDEVVSATVASVQYDKAKRACTFVYQFSTDEDTYREEATLYG